MRQYIKTVKAQIILLMFAFIIAVTVLVVSFVFLLSYDYRRDTVVQSTTFNLQLVSGIIEQDLSSLTTLASWCGNNSDITAYFQNRVYKQQMALDAYNRLVEEYMNNRSWNYVWRLIIVNNEENRILQVGSFPTSSHSVNIYSVGQLADYSSGFGWQEAVLDPYARGSHVTIPYTCPVYNSVNRSQIGTVHLMLSPSVFTDKLENYSLPENSTLYLTIDGNSYTLQNGSLIATETEFDITNEETYNIRDEGGKLFTVINSRIRSGIYLTQLVPANQFLPTPGAWLLLALLLSLLISVMVVIITIHLDKKISRPVAHLNKKIRAIAGGDFSTDPSLESESELGQVGRGINILSENVVALMDKRLADEMKQRDLEYRMLQSQINPHFLYNTLNSIKWMATIQNAPGIAELTTALSRLLRTIAKDGRKEVPLMDELDTLNEYIIIQQYRYGGNIHIENHIKDTSILNAILPRFSLQPLVENAIFHGIEPKGAGNVTLTAEYDIRGDILIHVTDDGVGMTDEQIDDVFNQQVNEPGLFIKMGFSNVDERLKRLFGVEYGLSIESQAGEFTRITIKVPPPSTIDSE